MNTKHPLQSKTILGVLISLIGSLAAQLNLEVLPGESQAIAESSMIIGGALLAIYGRYKAKQPIKPLNPGIPVALLPFLVVAISLQPGCNTLSDESRQSLRAVTKTATKAGLVLLLSKTPEAQPFLSPLMQGIDRAFAGSDDPAEIGKAIANSVVVTVADYATRQLLLDLMVAELQQPPVDDGITAGPPGQRAFELDLAHALSAHSPAQSF